MNQTELRSIDLALRAILLQIQVSRNPALRMTYEKILEAQDLIHSLLRKEQKNEELAERATELSKRNPQFNVKWEEK